MNREEIRISYTPTLLKAARRRAKSYNIVLNQELYNTLEAFLLGRVSREQLFNYESYNFGNRELEEVILPLRPKFRSVQGKKKIREVKNVAKYNVNALIDYLYEVHRLAIEEADNFENPLFLLKLPALITVLQAIACQFWPWCFLV